ncbi:MAG TPA: SDR family oxidoreductase [Ktedonobacterales bacterium]|nr:SDR family oxidoreductase [Ktedonobacterales bacterium]
MELLQDQVIFLTGGAQGIGQACALAYAQAGAHVVIADLNIDVAQQTRDALATSGLAVSCDVSDAASVQAAITTTLATFGHLDAVHNNAGVSSPSKSLHETTLEEWDYLLRVNLTSVLHTTRAAVAALEASRGCILNTASMVGLLGQENHAAYVATKGGLIALTKAMALDYAAAGIRVNAICPAAVWTPLLRQWVTEQPDPVAMEASLAHMHPLGYCPNPDVIADAATFLLSAKARFITGCILPVSGGAELGYRR